MSKSNFSKKVNEALAHTFNSEVVQKLSNEDYKQYIEAVSALTLGTLIKNEGHVYVRDFCQGALNTKDSLPVVQQIKQH